MKNYNKDIFILHISPSFSGGIGSFASNLINFQLNKGYKVGVGTFNNASIDDSFFLESLNESVITFIIKKTWFNKRPMLTGVPFRNMIKSIRRKYQGIKIVIHVHNPTSIGLLQSLDNHRIVCTLHGRNVVNSRLSNNATKIIINRLLKNKSKVVGVSKDTSDFYNEKCKKGEITTIYNGINILNYESTKDANHFNIGYVSRIVDGKGWEVVLEAVRVLNNKYPNVFKLIIAGEGEKSKVEKLYKLIDEYQISDIVDYKGFVKDAGNKIIPIIDVFVLPSESEGLPISILESLAHRVPVLATPVGGIPEVIVDGYNGLIISANSIDIAQQIEKLYQDEELYEKIKLNAYKSYKEKYKLSKMGNNYDNLYLELASGGVEYEN